MFKKCSSCKYSWQNRERFLADPTVEVVGYQPNFGDLKEGYFLFTHMTPACQTTVALQAGEFADLYKGPIFQERATGSEKCGRHCYHRSDLDPCPVKCECASVREVLQIVRSWKKQKS